MSMSKLTRKIPIWLSMPNRKCISRLQIRMSSNDSQKYVLSLNNGETNKKRFSFGMTAALCGAALINLWLLNEDTEKSLFNMKQINSQAKEQTDSDSNAEVIFVLFIKY